MSVTADGSFSLLPRRISKLQAGSSAKRGSKNIYIGSYFYRPTVSLATSMMAQSVVKQILTQGDAFLISIWSTPHAQGVYTLANNYGGLLARLVLQPIEESSRAYFSRELAPVSKADRKPGTPSKASAVSKASAASSAQYIQVLLRVYVLVSAIVMAVGPAGAPALLALVAGSSWTKDGAGEVLAVYCYYIPLIALNGITEALVASVASEAQVHRQSAWMTLFSLIYAAAGYICLVALDLGASGLVYANCINMLCRIAWSLHFVHVRPRLAERRRRRLVAASRPVTSWAISNRRTSEGSSAARGHWPERRVRLCACRACASGASACRAPRAAPGPGERHGRLLLRGSRWAPTCSADDQYGGAW